MHATGMTPMSTALSVTLPPHDHLPAKDTGGFQALTNKRQFRHLEPFFSNFPEVKKVISAIDTYFSKSATLNTSALLLSKRSSEFIIELPYINTTPSHVNPIIVISIHTKKGAIKIEKHAPRAVLERVILPEVIVGKKTSGALTLTMNDKAIPQPALHFNGESETVYIVCNSSETVKLSTGTFSGSTRYADAIEGFIPYKGAFVSPDKRIQTGTFDLAPLSNLLFFKKGSTVYPNGDVYSGSYPYVHPLTLLKMPADGRVRFANGQEYQGKEMVDSDGQLQVKPKILAGSYEKLTSYSISSTLLFSGVAMHTPTEASHRGFKKIPVKGVLETSDYRVEGSFMFHPLAPHYGLVEGRVTEHRTGKTQTFPEDGMYHINFS